MDVQKKIIPFITFFAIANPETFKLVRISRWSVPSRPGFRHRVPLRVAGGL
jgi:hypothetical protein